MTPNFRQPRYENRKLLNVAHDAPCMFRIEGVCVGDMHPRVPCHSNKQEHGRGLNHKSHDCYAPPGCPPCHYWYDYGKDASREEKEDARAKAQDRWILYLFESEKVKVA